MVTLTGQVTGVNGNLVKVSFRGSVRKNEVAYVMVGDKRLKGEVIRISNGEASMQIYEMSEGIKVGDPVEFTGELMSVELGPGLLTQVYDGLQNPLPDLAKQCGFFLERGVYLNPIPDREWDFTPAVSAGDRVAAGDTIGTVPEGVFTHQIMVPFITRGEWTVKSIKEKACCRPTSRRSYGCPHALRLFPESRTAGSCHHPKGGGIPARSLLRTGYCLQVQTETH